MGKKKREKQPVKITKARLLAREAAEQLDINNPRQDFADAASDIWEPAVRELALGIGMFLKTDGQAKVPMALAIGKIKALLEEVPESS